jgi:hypothetical protein
LPEPVGPKISDGLGLAVGDGVELHRLAAPVEEQHPRLAGAGGAPVQRQQVGDVAGKDES